MLGLFKVCHFVPPCFLSPSSSCQWPWSQAELSLLKDVSIPEMHLEVSKTQGCTGETFSWKSFLLLWGIKDVAGRTPPLYSEAVSQIERKRKGRRVDVVWDDQIQDQTFISVFFSAFGFLTERNSTLYKWMAIMCLSICHSLFVKYKVSCIKLQRLTEILKNSSKL